MGYDRSCDRSRLICILNISLIETVRCIQNFTLDSGCLNFLSTSLAFFCVAILFLLMCKSESDAHSPQTNLLIFHWLFRSFGSTFLFMRFMRTLRSIILIYFLLLHRSIKFNLGCRAIWLAYALGNQPLVGSGLRESQIGPVFLVKPFIERQCLGNLCHPSTSADKNHRSYRIVFSLLSALSFIVYFVRVLIEDDLCRDLCMCLYKVNSDCDILDDHISNSVHAP